MMPVGVPFGAVAMAGPAPGDMNATSSSWQIFTNASLAETFTDRPSCALARTRTTSPSAFSRTRARKAFTTPSSTSASRSESRTSRSAVSTFSSVSSVRPARRFFAALNPLDRASNMENRLA